MRRRTFLKEATVGITSLAAAGLASQEREGSTPNPETSSGMRLEDWAHDGLGRPVRISSVGFKAGIPLEDIVNRVDEEGSRGCDIVILPELCRGQNKDSLEQLDGPTVTAMAALAKKHKTYIVVPIDRQDGSRRLNSAVLLDRSGHVVYVYDKVFPFWSEYAVQPTVSPGKDVDVYQADFGRLGIATCFDANFPEAWRRLSDLEAELVIWPGAYSAGRSLQAHAINHHYYVVSCSQVPDCSIYDITGERLLYQRSDEINLAHAVLDFDRCIYHENFNVSKRDVLLKEHSRDIAQEQDLRLEQWFVLRAARPGVSARALAKQFGLEELRHYTERSRSDCDRRRGWQFEEKVVFPNNSVDRLKQIASEAEAAPPGPS